MKTKQNILEQLKDKEPFKVPEGYFDDLTNNIMQNLPEKEVEDCLLYTSPSPRD